MDSIFLYSGILLMLIAIAYMTVYVPVMYFKRAFNIQDEVVLATIGSTLCVVYAVAIYWILKLIIMSVAYLIGCAFLTAIFLILYSVFRMTKK